MRFVLAALLALSPLVAQAPENVYRGDLLAYPGPWAFQIGKQGFIVVRDDELEAIAADPDRVMNLSTGRPRNESLRQICEQAKAARRPHAHHRLRPLLRPVPPGPGQTPRRLTPDTDEYIQRIAAISRFARSTGWGWN